MLALSSTPGGQLRARLTHFQHPGLARLGLPVPGQGWAMSPGGGACVMVGEQGSEAVRGALWLGVVPWDGRRLALGGSEDRGEDGLWWQRGLWF